MSLRSILRSTTNTFQAKTTVAVAETTAALSAARQERDAKVEAYRAMRLSAPLENLAETLAPFQAQVDAAERLVTDLEARLADATSAETVRLAALEKKLDDDLPSPSPTQTILEGHGYCFSNMFASAPSSSEPPISRIRVLGPGRISRMKSRYNRARAPMERTAGSDAACR
jgi:Flp pilus assembly protein TadG